jgi:hypothetical protein
MSDSVARFPQVYCNSLSQRAKSQVSLFGTPQEGRYQRLWTGLARLELKYCQKKCNNRCARPNIAFVYPYCRVLYGLFGPREEHALPLGVFPCRLSDCVKRAQTQGARTPIGMSLFFTMSGDHIKILGF